MSAARHSRTAARRAPATWSAPGPTKLTMISGYSMRPTIRHLLAVGLSPDRSERWPGHPDGMRIAARLRRIYDVANTRHWPYGQIRVIAATPSVDAFHIAVIVLDGAISPAQPPEQACPGCDPGKLE